MEIQLENQLEDCNSIYLRRHSNNLVKWQLWSNKTFELAKQLNRPIFLSSGYSSCHWCKVMEKESFMDQETANILNTQFIPIKIDKDEYPDIDKEYQFYLQSTGEAGGWPLSVFLNHTKEPFFAGTYYPVDSSPEKNSFKTVLKSITNIYNNRYSEIKDVITTRREFMSIFYKPSGLPTPPEDEKNKFRLDEFRKILDVEYGGFRLDSKFPCIPMLNYLLKYSEYPDIYNFLTTTANIFCTSAILDHINGGYFRYTIDREWNYPHFEKILSDNAQVPNFLLKMYELTGNNSYLLTAKKSIDFVIYNMMTEYGVANSIDSDSLNSNGLLSEGYYYKVTDRDFTNLSQGELRNFPNEATIYEGIITLKSSEYIKIAALQPTLEKIAKRVSSVKTQPTIDKKVIASNNFLFCNTLLTCFEVSSEEWYLNQATALFHKLRHILVYENNIHRVAYGFEVLNHKTLEDYVYYLNTLLKFYKVTGEKEFIILAKNTVKEIENLFIDSSGIPSLDIYHKIKDTFDDDKPNPISLLLQLLIKYNDILKIDIKKDFIEYAVDRTARFPTGHSTLMLAL